MKTGGKECLKQAIYESTLSTADAVPLPQWGNAIKLSKILIAHVGNSVCFFHAFFLKVNNKTKKLIK